MIVNEENTQVKITMPLIDDIELKRIDTFYNDIVSEYTKAFVKEKDQVIAQRLMMNLQQENEQLKNKIDKAIEYIKNIDKFEERLNDDTRIYIIQDADVDEIERILKEN